MTPRGYLSHGARLSRDSGTAGRFDDSLADAAFCDHEECRDLGDPQALDEIGALVGVTRTSWKLEWLARRCRT